jgi:hypothetical protein
VVCNFRIDSIYGTRRIREFPCCRANILEKGRGFPRKLFEDGAMTFIEIQTVSASRVVFVARSFSKMLGTPKGRGIGSPFFAYFLWRSKESKLSPGNPRLGGGTIVVKHTSDANPPVQARGQCTLQLTHQAHVILHNEKQIPRQTLPGMTVHFLCAPKNNHTTQN